MKKVTGCWLLIVLVLSLVVIGCGGYQAPAPTPAPTPPPAPAPTPPPAPSPAPTPTPSPAPPPAPEATEIGVTAKFADFDPSTITVTKGQTVKLILTSTDAPHTFTIDELGINVSVGAGQTATEEFTVEEAGTFTFYCAVPGHRSAGMEGTLKSTE